MATKSEREKRRLQDEKNQAERRKGSNRPGGVPPEAKAQQVKRGEVSGTKNGSRRSHYQQVNDARHAIR